MSGNGGIVNHRCCASERGNKRAGPGDQKLTGNDGINGANQSLG